METKLKRTPLYEEHVRLGGRIVDFAGWEMPVQYKGLMEEHKCVRSNVGLFDVSHMGELWVTGDKALAELQSITSNDVSKLEVGNAQYSLLLNPQGGMVDDIIVYCMKKGTEYMICVNASNSGKDYEWVKRHTKTSKIENQSSRWAQIAIQGPKAFDLVYDVMRERFDDLKYYSFRLTKVGGQTWIVARTGYTGEKGVEVFLPNEAAPIFWRHLIEKGEKYGVRPIGLGARDTLRTEMKYALYGHEINDETSALEAGLGWVIKFNKGSDFIGKSALEAQKAAGLKRALIGFKLIDKGIPRQGYPLFSLENQQIGVVTSGTMSVTLNEPIGIGYLPQEMAAEGTEFFVQIRGRNVRARVVKTPFVTAKANA